MTNNSQPIGRQVLRPVLPGADLSNPSMRFDASDTRNLYFQDPEGTLPAKVGEPVALVRTVEGVTLVSESSPLPTLCADGALDFRG